MDHKLVVMSANSGVEHLRKCGEAVIDYLLSKAAEPAELEAVLKND
ncbi:response regulator [Zavarzinella formosa]|nr:hypothetical protein [Zavarzinella formosa]